MVFWNEGKLVEYVHVNGKHFRKVIYSSLELDEIRESPFVTSVREVSE